MGALSHFLSAVPAKMREADKRKHVARSFWLILLVLAFMPIASALVLVFLIGLAKACWDHFFGSGFCFYDMTGNFLGSAFGLSVAFVFTRIVGRGLVVW